MDERRKNTILNKIINISLNDYLKYASKIDIINKIKQSVFKGCHICRFEFSNPSSLNKMYFNVCPPILELTEMKQQTCFLKEGNNVPTT